MFISLNQAVDSSSQLLVLAFSRRSYFVLPLCPKADTGRLMRDVLRLLNTHHPVHTCEGLVLSGAYDGGHAQELLDQSLRVTPLLLVPPQDVLLHRCQFAQLLTHTAALVFLSKRLKRLLVWRGLTAFCVSRGFGARTTRSELLYDLLFFLDVF